MSTDRTLAAWLRDFAEDEYLADVSDNLRLVADRLDRLDAERTLADGYERREDENRQMALRMVEQRDKWRTLADDLADALTLALAQANDWTRHACTVLARHQKARQR